jgi:hypothetical protein
MVDVRIAEKLRCLQWMPVLLMRPKVTWKQWNKLQGWNFASEFYTLWIQEHTTKNCVKNLSCLQKAVPFHSLSSACWTGSWKLDNWTSYYYQILLLHNSHGKSIWLTWFYDIMHQILQYLLWRFATRKITPLSCRLPAVLDANRMLNHSSRSSHPSHGFNR